ncbi:MAG: ABC transporter ATP-binding protein [Firmicutes bacterium]|nr:ABC transporter ATP-binding protein [Bacillota bacterium]
MSKAIQALQIRNLRKKYSKVEALKGVDLTLPQGEIWALLGPNGSGKSTLLKCVVGLVKADGGEIEIFGDSPSRRRKGQIAFVPEVENLYRWMTVRQAVDFTAAFYADWDGARVAGLLEFMGLDQNKKVSSLSKGMRARLKLVLALARKAPLLLLDEPFSGIDPASRDRIVEGIVRQFKSEEQSMIISTHAVGDTEQLFDGVVFLDEGTINLQGNAEDLRNQYGKSINDLFKEVFA